MNGRNRFTPAEADQIREALRRKAGADRDLQKKLRGELRKLGFYITDFSNAQDGFLSQDFDHLVSSGRVVIEGAAPILPSQPSSLPAQPRASSPVDPKAVSNRIDADEAYVIDLCDEVLGRSARRQHRFSFLCGDSGRSLPVDAYYPDLNLVVEYRERQHTEAVAFFDRRRTISGVGRGEQRAIYDQRRREVLPQHGIRLVELSFVDFAHDARKRLRRERSADLQVVRSALSQWVSADDV